MVDSSGLCLFNTFAFGADEILNMINAATGRDYTLASTAEGESDTGRDYDDAVSGADMGAHQLSQAGGGSVSVPTENVSPIFFGPFPVAG